MRKLSSTRSVSFAVASCLVASPLLAQAVPAAPAAPAAAPVAVRIGTPPITTSEGYRKAGEDELKRLIADKPNDRKARNVIIFIGDGMSDYQAAHAVGTQFLARDTPALTDEWIRLGVRRHPDLTTLVDLVATW